MRDSVMWFLMSAVVLSSLSIIYVRHQHRIAYTILHAEESRKDALNDEWGQLLIEENLWAFPHHVEKKSAELLSMRAPESGEQIYVEPETLEEKREVHASR